MAAFSYMINAIDELITERLRVGYINLDRFEYGTPKYMLYAGMLDSTYHFAYDVAQFDCTIQDAIDIQWDEYFDACEGEDTPYARGYSMSALGLIERLKRIEHNYYYVTDKPIRHVLSVCEIDDFNIM